MGINRVEVCSAKEMLCEVVKDPNKYDYFISAAAVSDFAPSTYSEIKIKDKNHQLQLVKNPDIIYNFNSYIEDSDCVVIGFAAETNNVLANGKQKLIDKKLDWILINDVSENRVFGHDYNEIHATNQGTCCEFKGNKFSIAVDIVQLICF
jgi:phosphopantothenoylcysteine decarboxylase/phosphopantothenate--cysteine ligase